MHKGPGYSSPQEAAETLGVEIDVDEEVTVEVSSETESLLLADAVTAMTNYAGISSSGGEAKEVQKPFKHIKKRKPKDDVVVVEKETEVVSRNIFRDGLPLTDEDDELFEQDIEVARQANSGPYLISFEEFMQAEPGYQQPNATYFEADDLLLDDREQVIEDVDGTVGNESLQRFGWKSKNKDIVYVRNPRLELDFEITRSHGSYAQEVAGFIKHSGDRHGLRKFRLGDDE